MLKKKRINNNTEELNEKIKEQMKKKFGDYKLLKDKLFNENKKMFSIDTDIEDEIQDLTSGLETVTLTKSKIKESFINSPNKFKFPLSKNSTLKSNNLNIDKSVKCLFKYDNQIPNINSVISKTREEKDQIEKESRVIFL